MATHRSTLARELKGWLKTPPPRWLTRYPLMPEASAKLMFAIRGGIVLAGCAAFMLADDTHMLLNGEILIPVAAIVAVQHTIGATIQTAVRLFWAALAATCFSLIWISIFPRSNYSAVTGVATCAFIFSVLECPVAFKRFAMAGVIVTLLIWSDNESVGYSFPLEVGLSTLFGTVLGVIIINFPLPHAATVTREIGTRLRLVSHGMRNQLAAVALAFTHELPEELQRDFRARMQDLAVDVTDEIYGTATPQLSPVTSPKEGKGVGRLPQETTPPPELLRAQSLRYDEFDFDPADHVEVAERAPLLRADIADMNTRTAEHMAYIETALGALHWEVSSMWVVCTGSFKRGWDAIVRAVACCCCWRLFERFGCKPLCLNYWCFRPASNTPRAPLSIKDTLHVRLRRWVGAATRLHRITQAIMVAEKNSRPSFVHHRFVKLMANPLCRLVLAVGTHLDRCVSFAARQHYECMGQPFRLFLNAEWTGYAGDPCPTLEIMPRSRADVNEALGGFLVSFRQARHAIMYKRGKREWHAADLFAVNAFHFLVLRFVQTTLFAEGETISLHVPTTAAIASQLYVASPIIPFTGAPRPDVAITHVAGVDSNNDDDGEGDMEGVRTPIAGAGAGFGAAEHLGLPSCTPLSSTPGAAAPRLVPQYTRTPCSCTSWPCSARVILRMRGQCGRPATWRDRVLRLAAGLAFHIGFLPTRIAFKRALRVTLSVGIAAILGIVLQPVLNSSGFAYWAPISCAFMSGGSDGGTFKASTLRLMGTLIGATYGYFAVRIVEGNDIAIGVLTALWVAVMQFPRCDPVNGQWALVAAFTAAIVMLNSGGTSVTAQSLALTRIEQTVLGIFVFVVVHNLVFPVTARSLVKRRIETSVAEIRDAMCGTLNQLSRFVTHEVAHIRSVDAARAATPPQSLPVYTPLEGVTDTAERLGGVEKALASLPDLMSEAAMEPHLSAHGFDLVQPHYVGLAAGCDRAVRAIRILNQCFMALYGQSLLYHRKQAAIPETGTADPRQLTTLAHLIVAHHQGVGAASPSATSADTRSILSFYPMLDALQSLSKRLHTVLDTVVAAINDDITMDVDRNDNTEIARSASSVLRTQATPYQPPSTTSSRLPGPTHSSTRWDALGRLPVLVDQMLVSARHYLLSYCAFMHAHVEAIVSAATHTAAGGHAGGSNGSSNGGTPNVNGVGLKEGRGEERGGEESGSITPNSEEGVIESPLSSVDALCFNTIAFALHEGTEALADIARLTRRLRHAELPSMLR